MPMTDETIIRDVIGRLADEAPPALDFEELAHPTVSSRKSDSGPGLGRRWAAVGAAVAALVVVVGVVLAVRPAGNGATPVGAPAVATVQELRSALASGFDALESAAGVEGVQEAYIQGYLSGKVWFTSRPDGDTAVVQQADVDVGDTAWWTMSAGPPAEGERIVTTAWVVVDDLFYRAELPGDEESWQITDNPPSGPMAFGLLYSDPEFGDQFREQLAPSDAEVTRQATANGGTIWTARYDGDGQSRLYVHPEGHVASWEWQDLPPPENISGPIDSGSVTYTPLNDPAPITAPQIGETFDPAGFDLPDDFLIQTPDTPEAEGVIPIPDDHVANELLSEGASHREILDRSQDMDLELLCGQGTGVQWCALWDDGVVVVIPFHVPEDATAIISTAGYDGWIRPETRAGEPFAIWHGEGSFHLWYEQNGESLGGGSTDLPTQG